MKRRSGILLPIFSLPTKYGIGDFGESAYNFIDFLKKSNQTLWEILPLVQTGWGNSPYSSVCSTSLSIYYISPEFLFENKLITKKELKGLEIKSKYIPYGFLYENRIKILKKAFFRFDRENKEFLAFVKSKKAHDFALYTSIKNKNEQKPFYEWDNGLKYRDKKALKSFEKENREEVLFWIFTQFLAEKEWIDLKKYANKQGVKIIGDLPLYVSKDSVDVWVNPKLFKLNSDLTPKKVAGVPPDYFSKDGQLWGNPVYDYEMHKKDNFVWWTNRVKHALKRFDYVRIDHFRGLDRYFEIECDAETARVGEWIDVPSVELFNALHSKINKEKIIAEDLGIIDDGVRELLKFTNYPGMKILSFAFNGDRNNPYLPKNVEENSVCFTGTHDNDTLLSLIKSLSGDEKSRFVSLVKESMKEFNVKGRMDNDISLSKRVIELGASCFSKFFILPLFDLLLKDTTFRINEPGTVKEQNWGIKLSKLTDMKKEKEYLLSLNKKYNRNKKILR